MKTFSASVRKVGIFLKSQIKLKLSISIMVLVSFWSIGCNNDTGTTPGEGTPQINEPRPVSPEERTQIMDTINNVSSQFNGLNPIDRAQGFITFLSKIPGVLKCGIDSGCVWGLFADGQPFIILCEATIGDTTDTVAIEPDFLSSIDSINDNQSFSLPKKSTCSFLSKTARTDSIRPGIPSGNKARLLNGFTDAWFNRIPQNINPYMAKLLRKKGYQVTEEEATVEAFKNVTGDAVLHIRTHGGIGHTINDTTFFALWTTTQCTKEIEAIYALDLKKIALVRMFESISGSEKAWHLGITSEFINAYWGLFADGAYVHVSACWGGANSPSVDTLRRAMSIKGAALYTGWSYPTPIVHLDKTALFVFDRMLGTNALSDFKVNPPQRPMGAVSVLREMVYHKIDEINVGSKKAHIAFFPNSYGDRLSPSIGYLVTDEANDKLQINGIFGWEADSAIVTIGGTQAEVYSESDNNRIYCKLARSGPGSSGDVIVKIRGRESNRVRLSEWSGSLTYTLKGPESSDLHQTWKFDIVLRGDVHDYRLESGIPPKPCKKWVSIVPSRSSCTYTFSGTHHDEQYMVNWEGSGNIQCSPNGSADIFLISAEGTADQQNRLWWTFYANKMKGNNETIYNMKNSEWESMGTNTRNYKIPFGSSMTSSSNPSFLSTPAELLSDGTIKGGTIGPIFLPENDFNTWYLTNWIWSHELTWTTMKPVSETEIDDQMPR